MVCIMNDTELNAVQRDNTATATVAVWPPPADALYSDRISLLQHDPEQYFAQYPRL